MNDDRLDDTIRELSREYHRPPPTPREEMWEAIEAARRAERPLAARWYRAWVAWGVGIAAVLLVGVGLGRLSVRPAVLPPPTAAADPAPAAVGGGTAYRMATTQHLGQAELLLTSFRAEARSGEIDARVGTWAGELLSTTRLLLDSPAGADPALRPLLEDLELVLVQLSQLPADDSTEEAWQEVELATDAIEEARMLPKIRTAIQEQAPAMPISQEGL
jgi:hypothetical protein